MSSFKKRAKSVQRKHRERGQPSSRKHLGLLEKHKDYIERATSYKRKAAQLKALHEKARNRNRDEFYYKMINTRLRDGRHVTTSQPPDSCYTDEQLRLMKTQDLKYIQMKLSIEKAKIEQLRSSLHQTRGGGEGEKLNSHIIFVDNESDADREEPNEIVNESRDEENHNEKREESELEELDETPIIDQDSEEENAQGDQEDENRASLVATDLFHDLSKFEKDLAAVDADSEGTLTMSDGKEGLLAATGRYKELERRQKRCKELVRVCQEMQTQKHLLNKREKPMRVKSEGTLVTYKWRTERKR